MPIANRSRSARRHLVAFTLAGTLALAACQHAPPPPSNATPEQAVATSLRLTAAGDFDGLMQNRLPPAEYTAWRAEWDKQHAQPVPASVDQQKQFADIMRMLTEPDAEAKLAKRLAPQLQDLHGGKGQPMPIFGSILEAAIKQMIAESPQLGPAQQTLANQGLAALAAWAATVDFSDTKKAGKAIALVCATARALHVQTLAQWRALDYTTTMKDYGVIWNGLEKLLDLYGIDVTRTLARANTSAVALNGDHATVKLELTLADKLLSAEWPMVKQAGHWYDAALLDAWQKAHPVSAASTATPGSEARPAGVDSTTTPASAASTRAASAPSPRPTTTAAGSKPH